MTDHERASVRRSGGKLAAPLIVAAALVVAVVGTRAFVQVAPAFGQMAATRAGALSGPGGGPDGRDLRFGIAEGQKNQASKSAGIGWERLVFAWDQVQPGGPDEFRADLMLPPDMLQAELSSGVQVVGLLQFTPAWAQSNPADGHRSVPKNLSAAWDSPDNYWGQFTRTMATHYRGRVDAWVIWNEPEIRPTDAGGGSSWTFAGGPVEYAQLLRVAYMNVKAANPDATVVFAGTGYWLDENSGREQFFKRVLDELAADPNAAANNWYFDAVGFNIYRAPDDIYRIAFEMREVMRARGLDKQLWLTETNAMPFDPHVPCAERFQGNPSNVDLDTQARFAVQSLAIALAAGWNRVEFYQMTDSGTCQQSSIWGLARDDGTLRPAFQAFKTAIEHLSGTTSATFAPLERDAQRWGIPWPNNPSSYYPNWQIYQVVADRGDQRISVLWNADGTPARVRVAKVGAAAVLVDKFGSQQPLAESGGWYVVDLGPASARGPFDPDGYFYIGGDPLLIVQSGVPAGTPVSAPALGDPGSGQPGFRAFVSPENGQKVSPGGSAQFSVRVAGQEGFADPVQVRFKEYSTQRDPTPVGSLPGSLTLDVPDSIRPGQSVDVEIHTSGGIAPGIHFVTLRLDGGGMSQTLDLVVQVD